ncbi:MAG: HAD family phosphatase [Chlamydiota bacterium]|nr:HAD family phosphatase [Chlamydiota bacterium]
MKEQNIKAIIFDIGNVVLFFNNHLISQKIAESSGLGESNVFREILTRYNDTGLDVGHISGLDFLQTIKTNLKIDHSLERLQEIFCDIFNENAQMAKLIRFLKGKYKLLALSNTNELHFPYIRDNFPILQLFEEYILSYEEGIKKPDLDIYLRALDRLSLNADEVLFIDDQKRNIIPACALEIHAHHYTEMPLLLDHMKVLGIDIALYDAS